VAEVAPDWLPGRRPAGYNAGFMLGYAEGYVPAQRRMVHVMSEAKLGQPPSRAEELLQEYDTCDDFEDLAMDLIRCSTWEQLLGKLVCRIKRRR
jgi:hypothetical protein